MNKIILYLSLFTLLFLAGCAKKMHVANADFSGYQINIEDEAQANDEHLEAIVAPYRNKLEAEMNQVIGECEEAMFKSKPESTLGNWLSDIFIWAIRDYKGMEVDFAFQNYGGIRVGSIQAGPITKSAIYELMPFDNLISVLELGKEEVQLLLDDFARSGGGPMSNQIRFEIQEGKAINITFKGEPIEEGKKYKVGMPDYIANGGGGLFFLSDLPRTDLDYLVRDAIIDYVEDCTANNIAIKGEIDGRIKVIN